MRSRSSSFTLAIATALAAVALAAAGPVAAPAPQDPKLDQVTKLVQQKMAEYGVPGVALGIYKGGQLFVRGFGITNVDNPQAVTPDTIFALASISKTVTTTAIMRLVEQGKIDLNAPVKKYLPDFRVQDEGTTNNVAIWHLLTHTPGWEGQLTAADRGPLTLASFIEQIKDLPKLAEPGEVWSYNNAGFNVAGRIIEVVTGKSIHEAFRTEVFEPIGLTRAFTQTEMVATYPFVVAHTGAPGQVSVSRPLSRSVSIAAGGVSMSLNDLMTYAKFHLGDGNNADGKPVLSKKSLELMRTPRFNKNSRSGEAVRSDIGADEMGLGWHLRRVGGVTTAAHGGTLGNCLLIELVPDRDFAIAILTNHTQGWRLIQDVERMALRTLEEMTLDPVQPIGHRGVNETMPDAPIMAKQPDSTPYLGKYKRPPSGQNVVRVQDGTLMLDNSPIAFYAPDLAVVTSGNSKGNPVEFIRDKTGAVRWVRSVGRIARRD